MTFLTCWLFIRYTGTYFRSCRDYALFSEVFEYLGLTKFVKYSKITTLSEDTTAAKGDIRAMTESLLQQNLLARPNTNQLIGNSQSVDGMSKIKNVPVSDGSIAMENNVARDSSSLAINPRDQVAMEEILLVDEVDVFFGPDFYGQTYNKVMELHEPEIAEILSDVWTHYVQNTRKQKLVDIQSTSPYVRLVQKMPTFRSLIDNEIKLMLNCVHRVDEEKYYLDADRDLIGYKVHDTISYHVTYERLHI